MTCRTKVTYVYIYIYIWKTQNRIFHFILSKMQRHAVSCDKSRQASFFFISIKDWSFRNATYYWNHTNDVWFQLAGNFQRFRKFNGDTVVLNEDLLYSPSAFFKLNVAPCKDRGHAIVRRGKKKHYVGVRRYSQATFTFQFRECIYLQFPPGCCAIKAQIKQPCIWAEPLLFPCAPFGVSHNFTLRPKWWWIIHPGLFHLRLTKVVGGLVGVGRGGMEGGLCASGKHISGHWLRVDALSRSAGVVPAAASVIKAHVRSSYFIRQKNKQKNRGWRSGWRKSGEGLHAQQVALLFSRQPTVYSGVHVCFKLGSLKEATGAKINKWKYLYLYLYMIREKK